MKKDTANIEEIKLNKTGKLAIERKKRIVVTLLLLLTFSVFTEQLKATTLDIVGESASYFSNKNLLSTIFDKLYDLDLRKDGKINIVHIGDSHIQGDYFTGAIREDLQNRFGNGGYGFTFPYALMGSNGSRQIQFVSNTPWQSLLNISPVADVGVGLSGIALYTSSSDFLIQLKANENYTFTKVTVLYPADKPIFKIAPLERPLNILSTSTETDYRSVHHEVKKGETLSSIAGRYNVTVDHIKRNNSLKSNTIQLGKTLVISYQGGRKTKSKVSKFDRPDKLKFANLVSGSHYSSYTSETPLNQVAIYPSGNESLHNVNGFVLENNKPGIIYHSIGVNGAKISDYNKYPLFFEQLPILSPDLIILSFGTNESFGRLSTENYINNLKKIVNKIRNVNIDAVILVMTPPPSLFRRRQPNPYAMDYSVALAGLSNLPVWDLYSRFGGMEGIRGDYSELIAKDNVHYTVKGYELQGRIFVADFLYTYNEYINLRKTESK